MPVRVIRRSRGSNISAKRVAEDARHLLRALGEIDSELTVVLVDDEEMRRFNYKYRGQDRPTDVLAFAMREGERVPHDEAVLGDVVISLETAARQGRARRTTIAEEVRTLLIHGLLHLLGYDHERSAAEARQMRAKERGLRAMLEDRPSSAVRSI